MTRDPAPPGGARRAGGAGPGAGAAAAGAHWFALHLPLLPLEAFCATLPPGQALLPVALVAEHRVRQVNAAAAALGLRPGMQRATAQALAAALLLAESHAGREAAALQAVAHAALTFTPAVALHDEQTVLMDVHASLRLFGGAAALQQRLADALAPLGHHVQMAAAPTALGAALLAQWPLPLRRAGGGKAVPASRAPPDRVLGPHATDLKALQQLLQQAPVWLLGPGREHWDALQGMGLHTLADLRALPRSGVARRFGEDLLDELDRAWGERPDPRVFIQLTEVFDSRLELFARADTTDQVLHGAQVLLRRLVAWAQARQVRVAAFTLRMLHEKSRQAAHPPTALRIELAEPALDPAHLQLLLRERLARLPLVAPTLDLQLQCRDVKAGALPNGELFPTRASEDEGLTRLLERLRARLGDEQVVRLVAVADHRPERATATVPAQGGGGTAARGNGRAARAAADAALSPQRPAWLLPEPLPLHAKGAVPLLDGRPLRLLSGPERIETGWWDGDAIARDYFIAQRKDGSLLWIYRARLPLAAGEPMWHLHGLFG